MVDTIVEAIRTGVIEQGNISFNHLRNIVGRKCGLWKELGRGRAILCSPDQLDQYLHSYGLMTKSQWDQSLEDVALPPGGLQIVDYGCGQGLSGALLFDNFGYKLVERVARVVLIEPSEPALTRAQAVLACYCENAEIICANKKLDDLGPDEVRATAGVTTVHLLSNVLDIEDFDHFDLFSKIFNTKGSHCILAVSHDREFYGGSARFRALESAVNDPQYRNCFTVVRSDINQFHRDCGQPVISWNLRVEVLHGSFRQPWTSSAV